MSLISDADADLLFRMARSYDVYEDRPVTDTELRELYELMKWGPTTANSQPQRVVFVRSKEAKELLYPALSKQNTAKSMSAPVVAILAYDMRFFEHLPRMYHNPAARSWYETTPEQIRTTALRNATLQGAYLMLAARAVGLDCGPMSQFQERRGGRGVLSGRPLQVELPLLPWPRRGRHAAEARGPLRLRRGV